MALNGDNLASEIKTAYDAIKPEDAGDIDLTFLQALSNAIIDHIITNGHATGSDSGGDTHNLSIE
jgi:hypothetical protein